MSKASVGVNEKDICYKKINEILNSVETKFDDGVLKEAIQALDIFSRKDTPIVDKDTKLLEKYRSVLSSVLTNPKLLPQAKDIIEVFEQFTNGATKDRAASIKDLTDRVLTDKK